MVKRSVPRLDDTLDLNLKDTCDVGVTNTAISKAWETSEATINKCYRILSKYRAQLFPDIEFEIGTRSQEDSPIVRLTLMGMAPEGDAFEGVEKEIGHCEVDATNCHHKL